MPPANPGGCAGLPSTIGGWIRSRRPDRSEEAMTDFHLLSVRKRWFSLFLVTGVIALLALGGLRDPAAAQGPDGADTGGRIVGRIVDETTAEPLSGVQVYIAGTQQGTLTDINGRYLILNVASGTHDLVAEMLGFGKKTVTGVVVDAGATLSMDISLAPRAIEMEAITVSAEREQGSNVFLLDQRSNSVSMVDAIGAANISRSGDSDAADVAKRMTGVTVSDGKFVYVRGLGERYSQTSLNGSPLPSPEPEKEVVPLDLFPAGFLESLTTQKSYTPDQPSDFSGGSVQIKTKDFPDRFQLRIGVGTSFNSMSQGRNDFLSYSGGGLDFLGVDDGTRAFPNGSQGRAGRAQGHSTPRRPEPSHRSGAVFLQGLHPHAGEYSPESGFRPLGGGNLQVVREGTGVPGGGELLGQLHHLGPG